MSIDINMFMTGLFSVMALGGGMVIVQDLYDHYVRGQSGNHDRSKQ